MPIEPRRNDTDTSLPSVQELLDRPRGMTPNSTPLVPPVRHKVAPPSLRDTPSESTIPFSPSDGVVLPQDPFPTNTETDPPITIEELRRLDPSVRDIQIISIEDAAVGTAVR
jgi:hypothetical protein